MVYDMSLLNYFEVGVPYVIVKIILFYFAQVTAVLLAIGGITLFGYTEGFQGPNVIGVVLSVLAAVGSALYQVSFVYLFHNTLSTVKTR